MEDISIIAANIAGSPNAKQRRTDLVAELGKAFAESGPQAVTDEMSRRVDALVDAFTDHLHELKKQI